MRLSKTSEYAIRVMVWLNLNRSEFYSVKALHKKLNIPYKYLAKLMHKLASAKLLEVVQGKQGGYRINSALKDIYLYQIVGVVDSLDDYDRCVLGFPECSDTNPCPMHHIWKKNLADIKDTIFNTALSDLENGSHVKY